MDYSKLASKLGGAEDASNTDASNTNQVDYAALASKVGGNATQTDNEPSMTDRLLHQAGLTGRHLIEGAADTVGLVSDPIAAIMNAGGANASSAHDVGQYVADKLGLPTPQNATERVVGDASRMLVGTGGIIKGANLASKSLSPIAQKVAQSIGSRPDYQAASAIGGGTAGGTAREEGGSPTTQLISSLIGSVGVPVATSSIEKGVNRATSTIKDFLNPQELNDKAAAAIQSANINLGDFSKGVQQSLIQDVKAVLKTGNNLSPDALRRLADYRALNATPIRSSLTLNPADITNDRNMAKLAANSRDPAAQKLAMVQNENNQTLVNSFNDLGANATPDQITAGNRLIGALSATDQANQSAIGQAYNAARDTSGRSALLDASAFTNRANDLLDNALLGGKLPADVRNLLNKTATGQMPLTVDTAEQFKTRIGDLQRATNDRAEKMALGLVRQSLDEAPLISQSNGMNTNNLPVPANSLPPGQSSLGQDSIDAFNKARGMNRAYMQQVEQTPALAAVRDGIEPDKFVSQYIIGGKNTINDLAQLKNSLADNPDALQTIRGQILAHLKGKAVNGAADEVANVSPTAFNKAMKDIGDQKLSLFFSPEDINTLKTIGRVASYEKFQPTGSAVNNSNTAAATITALIDKVANSPLVRKIPLGSALLANPAQDIATAIGARNSLNAPRALAFKPEPKQAALPLGALLYGGSLASTE